MLSWMFNVTGAYKRNYYHPLLGLVRLEISNFYFHRAKINVSPRLFTPTLLRELFNRTTPLKKECKDNPIFGQLIPRTRLLYRLEIDRCLNYCLTFSPYSWWWDDDERDTAAVTCPSILALLYFPRNNDQ